MPPRPHQVERPLDRSTVAWIVEQVVGDEVALFGRFDALVLASLGKSRMDVRLHPTTPSIAECAIEQLPASRQDVIRISDTHLVAPPDQDWARADTVIVQGCLKGATQQWFWITSMGSPRKRVG